jgi:hypothetical protein
MQGTFFDQEAGLEKGLSTELKSLELVFIYWCSVMEPGMTGAGNEQG